MEIVALGDVLGMLLPVVVGDGLASELYLSGHRNTRFIGWNGSTKRFVKQD